MANTTSPLTKKAKQAIYRYCLVQQQFRYSAEALIDTALEADRMPRSDLYAWLSKHGYVWDLRYSFWRLKRK